MEPRRWQSEREIFFEGCGILGCGVGCLLWPVLSGDGRDGMGDEAEGETDGGVNQIGCRDRER